VNGVSAQQRIDMGGCAASEGGEVIASLEDGYDRAGCGVQQRFRDESEVIFVQVPIGIRIRRVAIKSGRYEQQFRVECRQRGRDMLCDSRPESPAAGSRRQADMMHTGWGRGLGNRRVEGVLEQADEERLLIGTSGEDAFRAISVVHVEVHDGRAADAVLHGGVGHADSYVVVETESHGLVPGGMVAGRPHGAEGAVRSQRCAEGALTAGQALATEHKLHG